MIVETYGDAFNSIGKTLFFTAEDQKAEEMEAWKNGILTKLLKIVEKQLESNATNKFLVGHKMTIVDFSMACLLFNILKNEQGPLHALCSQMLLEYPYFGAYAKRLESELKSHLTARPKYVF